MEKREGNVGDLMITAICLLAMTVILLAYMDSADLIQRKAEVGQLARKYILRMETVGYLTAEDQTALTQELVDIGVTEIDYAGTTVGQVTYGCSIVLKIQGKLKGEYVFEEHRVSTAKN
ncbi:MAG: hypothetical protein NC417_09640 [Candidatus Gastranaerophilales bacterium]|nr:hypothetical protein [Candidatus Gastranaerophilales bacterium]